MPALLYEKPGELAYVTLNRPEDAREGPRAFAEKRKPRYLGR